MNLFVCNQQAFKRAAQNLSKLPGAGSLSACQTILAQATGHRDLHQVQTLKWSQESGQSAKVYPKPLKGYENGEAPELYRPV